ncbi:MAG: MFS transporter [Sphaerochaetaceae bacterium]|jgi:GPH family glycoside/pentoside/hexuronide:cation symporter|nr:MFS transporter [Sphaerochaetaceae bacterium]NLO61625.1 MFS transporter [Spirochaetales bacterium]MDD3670828.1 MFS transporter [Sphaerochaetaceae bacterium]MDD4259021.1 MFS transporter [Sphaerochaetaceae bacterium]MDD4762408.1 MFS transporter [Sphaerochaetaceae bacterium]
MQSHQLEACATKECRIIAKVSKRIKFGFGIGDLGGNIFFTVIGFYLLYFLTDIVELSAALAGTVLMIGKIWDAVTDPITGYISDRTRSRWGRRRPYMFVGTIISFITMGLMFTKPSFQSQLPLFAYLTFMYCLLNTAYTLVNIPYAALLPELTDDFNERTILTGYRMSFAVVGTFVGAGAVMPIIGMVANVTLGWTVMGYFMGAVMLLSTLVTIWAIREPEHPEAQPEQGLISTFVETLKDKVFLTALIPWALFITGTSMVQGALVYYYSYIFHDEGQFQIALMFLLAMSLLFIPVWVKVSQHIGKKKCYMIGMTIMGAGVMVFSLLGEQMGTKFALIVMALSGVGLSTHYVMPHSILPDVVEHDAIEHGNVRREGVFSSMWTFSSKIGQALALALNGWILALFAYEPNTTSKLAEIGIKLICGPIPLIWYIIGILILRFYPIDKAYYATMLERKANS